MKLNAGRHRQSQDRMAYAALAGGVLATAWSAVFVRWAPIAGPASAFYRVFLAGLLFWPYLLLKQRQELGMSPRLYALAALGGFFFAGDLATYNTAVLQTSAANAVILGNHAPILVGLFSWLLWQRPPGSRFWLGLMVAISGAFLLLRADRLPSTASAHANSFRGDLLALTAAAFFAGYLMVTERVRNEVSSAALLGISLFSSSVCLALFDAAFSISLHVPGLRIWAALIAMAVVSQVIGYFLLTYALGHLPATLTSVTLLAQAPLAALLAFLLLGERYGVSQIMGTLLVLGGVGIVNLQRSSTVRSKERPDRPL